MIRGEVSRECLIKKYVAEALAKQEVRATVSEEYDSNSDSNLQNP